MSRAGYLRAWRKKNPSRVKQHNARWGSKRRAKKYGAKHEAWTLQDVLEKSCGECTNCGSVENLTVDHIRPLRFGGNDVIDNLQILCRACNAAKDYEDREKWQE